MVEVFWVVVTVTEALPGAVTLDGLTRQAGVSVRVEGTTVQDKLTTPPNPPPEPTVTLVAELPPGGTAGGEKGAKSNVKLWANADEGKATSTARMASATRLARPIVSMNLGCKGLGRDDFNVLE